MTVLHLDASINGENSASRAISRSIVDRLGNAPRSSIAISSPTRCRTSRLKSSPIQPCSTSSSTQTRSSSVRRCTISRSRPSSRRGSTASSWPAAPSGTPRTAPKAWPETSASLSASPAAESTTKARPRPRSSTSNYLRGVFNFIGIEPEFVAADGLAISPEQREQSLAGALGKRCGSPPSRGDVAPAVR